MDDSAKANLSLKKKKILCHYKNWYQNIFTKTTCDSTQQMKDHDSWLTQWLERHIPDMRGKEQDMLLWFKLFYLTPLV